MKIRAIFLAVLMCATFGSQAFAGTSPSGELAHIDGQTAGAVRIALVLGLMSLLPALIICMTPFLRIVISLSMIRHAFGMPETPPTAVLVSISLLLTVLMMGPALSKANADGLSPFLEGKISIEQAIDKGGGPFKSFMLRQIKMEDVRAVARIQKSSNLTLANMDTVSMVVAFLFNELRTSFKIGFVILLPFLMVDLIVASILISLGMMMVPPTTLSLPLKILLFVLVDGWTVILQGVVFSFK